MTTRSLRFCTLFLDDVPYQIEVVFVTSSPSGSSLETSQTLSFHMVFTFVVNFVDTGRVVLINIKQWTTRSERREVFGPLYCSHTSPSSSLDCFYISWQFSINEIEWPPKVHLYSLLSRLTLNVTIISNVYDKPLNLLIQVCWVH